MCSAQKASSGTHMKSSSSLSTLKNVPLHLLNIYTIYYCSSYPDMSLYNVVYRLLIGFRNYRPYFIYKFSLAGTIYLVSCTSFDSFT